jgi:hypothetical protein
LLLYALRSLQQIAKHYYLVSALAHCFAGLIESWKTHKKHCRGRLALICLINDRRCRSQPQPIQKGHGITDTGGETVMLSNPNVCIAQNRLIASQAFGSIIAPGLEKLPNILSMLNSFLNALCTAAQKATQPAVVVSGSLQTL